MALPATRAEITVALLRRGDQLANLIHLCRERPGHSLDVLSNLLARNDGGRYGAFALQERVFDRLPTRRPARRGRRWTPATGICEK